MLIFISLFIYTKLLINYYLDKYVFSNEDAEQNYINFFETKIIEELKKLVDNDEETISSKLRKRGIIIKNSLLNAYDIEKYISFENVYNEIPSRSIILGNLPNGTTEEDIKCIINMFGEYSSINFNELLNGRVVVNFFNLKDSMFMRASSISIKNRPVIMSFGKPIQTSNKNNPSNNGTIIIFNLPKNVSNDEIYKICTDFGEIRQIHNTQLKKTRRIVEFYDLRDAFMAKKMLNYKKMNINGKFCQIKVNFTDYTNVKCNNKCYNHNVPTIQRRSVTKTGTKIFILANQSKQQIRFDC